MTYLKLHDISKLYFPFSRQKNTNSRGMGTKMQTLIQVLLLSITSHPRMSRMHVMHVQANTWSTTPLACAGNGQRL